MTYQPGIPTGTIPLNQDYLNIQNNFGQINTQFNVDHVPLTSTSGTPPNGYHTSIHSVPQSPPAATTGYGQLYSQTLSGDQSLFWLTGGNKNIQLTSNIVPVASAIGYTFLAGGIILQWGSINAVGNTLTPVTFVGLGNISFPSNCFGVFSNINVGVSSNANVLNVTSVTKTGFSYYNTSSSARMFYYMAIGN